MSTIKSISIIMPTLNEEEGVCDSISSIPFEKLRARGINVEVLIVDGGSTDSTVAVAKKFGARVVHSQKGYGRQYREGLKHAQGDVIVAGDSDGTYPFEDIVQYLDELEKKSLDFITMNRFSEMEDGAMHFSNVIGNWGLTLFCNLLFSLGIKDSQSGMWVLRRELLDKMCLTSDGMAFSQEIKIEAFQKCKSAEINGRYKQRVGETKLARFRDGFLNLKHLFEKRFKLHS